MSDPRPEHGFCTDDNARALVVVSQPETSPDEVADLAATYLGFVLDARAGSGRFHNRCRADGVWLDEFGGDDCQGRAWWGLGAAARMGPTAAIRGESAEAFAACTAFESPHLRSNAYAALGAVEMLAVDPGHRAATDLLERTSRVIVEASHSRIPWPEARLTYDNARLPEALLGAGLRLGRGRLIKTGARLLEWLVRVETNRDHFSFTPSTGWEPGESRPAFDQQPIEAWAMATACHRAWSVTGEDVWRLRAAGAAQWLMGRNDTGMVLHDAATGGTSDGLMPHSINDNLGAESTLAGIAALQIAAMCVVDDRGKGIL